ncbi:MAG: hypothetical protein ACP5O2_10580 [Bacteroidales bacterium]
MANIKSFCNFIVISTIFGLLISGCQNQTTPIPPLSKPQKVLIVVGDDRSGSTVAIRKLDTNDYRQLFNLIQQYGGGTLAVEIIGNPQPQQKQPFTYFIKPAFPLYQFDPMDPKYTLTQKKNMNLKNDSLNILNQSISRENQSRINKYLTEIQNNVITYIPSGGDHTDINSSFLYINKLLNEPIFNQYNKTIIIICSDGIHQPRSKIEPITEKLQGGRAEVLLLGWQTDKQVIEGSLVHEFADKTSLLEYLHNSLIGNN